MAHSQQQSSNIAAIYSVPRKVTALLVGKLWCPTWHDKNIIRWSWEKSPGLKENLRWKETLRKSRISL